MTERRQGEQWGKKNFVTLIGLLLTILGLFAFAARWSERIEAGVAQSVTKIEFTQLSDKVNTLQDRVNDMNCKLNNGCGANMRDNYAPPTPPARDYSRSGVNHP